MVQVSLRTDVEILLEKSALVGHSDLRDADGNLTTLQGPTQIITDKPGAFTLVHAQAESLKKLFFQNNKANQASILEVLKESIEKGGQISRTASLALIETGNVSILIDIIRRNFTDHNQYGYHTSLMLLSGYTYYFWTNLTLTQVRDLRDWAKQVKSHENDLGKAFSDRPMAYGQIIQTVDSIYNQTTHILAADVEERINTGYNPEVNEDREKIKTEISRFGFPADLSETLDKIDLKFSQAHDAFDFKGCMDLIRAFTERLYRSILDAYDENGRNVDEKDSDAVAKFFETNNLVSDHFASMIAQQRHFLSDQGSHRIKSREEDARLSKNMVIEMSLYLLRRFENH